MYVLVILMFVAYAKAAVVTIEQGTLNGTFLKTRGGKLFNAFYGIPFAQPPIGELRFKAPKEAGPWDGILDATRTPKVCVQADDSGNSTIGDEDCLNLNIYSPLNSRIGDKIPVLVYIFGGNFEWYNNVQFGPQYIMERDVVMVVPNYRLGVLGFMTTGDTILPGNYQLKDQSMALKWVQKNIHRFGGDPGKVTLHGHSSGSECVHLHTVSRSSKGLFHRAIMQSGTAPYDFFGPDIVRDIAKEFARKVGCCDIATSSDIYNCLMKADVRRFPLIEDTLHLWDSNPAAIFKPTIEDKRVKDAFLTEVPSTSQYHTPDMPWIIGLTTGEAGFMVAHYLSDGGKLAAEINEHYKILFPISLEYLWNTKMECLNYDSEMLRRHYFGYREIGNDTSHEMTELYTHAIFGIAIVTTIYSYPGPKYVYWYDYKSNYSQQNLDGYYPEDLGVSHGEDIFLIVYTEESDENLTTRDVMFSEELVKRWVNFIDTGNPNFPVEINKDIFGFWDQMTTNRIEYMRIKLNGSMENDLYKGIYQFWKSLPIGNKYQKDKL